MRSLVTGGTGFVGSAVVRKLIEAEHDVRVLVREHSPRDLIEDLDVEAYTGDLRNPASLRKALEGCSALFHVAADYRLWVPDPELMYETNVRGTENVMEAALAQDVDRIVYTSSVATLGHPGGRELADETTPSSLDQKTGPYKRSKFLAEQTVLRMVEERDLPAVIVNPSAPVGPRDIKPTPTGQIIVDAASGNMPAYVDTGLNIAHVNDIASGHRLALERGTVGRRYILGSENLTLQELLHELADLCGRSPPWLRIPRLPLFPIAWAAEQWARLTGSRPLFTVDEIRMAGHYMYFSSRRARDELGYRPRPAREALRDALNWFQDHGYIEP